MNVRIFSSFLVVLIFVLMLKTSFLFGRIKNEASTLDTSVGSAIVDTAYAKDRVSRESSTKEIVPSEKNIKSEIASGNKSVVDSKDIASGEKKDASPIDSEVLFGKDIPNLSSSELKLLKELIKRRNQIEKEREDVTIREQVLSATESKIDQKMLELNSKQKQLDAVMKQYEDKEHAKILSLVKIYENMKPRDAAKIFDELDMSVLLQVVRGMKEVKAAPIIANMNHVKARELSMELAKQKELE
jgi:flagellar motility protein MotE (MotC chaperone)